MNEETNTEPDKGGNPPKKGGNPSRELLYAQAAKHAPKAIEVLVQIMTSGDNDNARMAAAKVILAKAVPDISTTELSGPNGQPIPIVNINRDYVSPQGWTVSTPTGYLKGSNQVQGSDLAQTSSQDLNRLGKDSIGSTQRPEQNILDSISHQDSSQRSDLEGSEHVVSDHTPESDRTTE